MASDLFAVAYAKVSKGQFDQAIPMLEALCERNASSSAANILMSAAFLGARRFNLARNHAATARTLSQLVDRGVPLDCIDEFLARISAVEAWRPTYGPSRLVEERPDTPLPPQIEDLYKINIGWMPYLNWMMRPNQTTPSISTDGYGCRHTIGRDGQLFGACEFAGTDYFGFFGASAAFGAGASGNDKTIPSRLTALGDGTPWLNFAIPSSILEFNLMSALFLRPLRARPRAFVVFAGANELYAPLSQPVALHPFGCCWHIPDFLNRMMGPTAEWAPSMGPALVDPTPAAERDIGDVCRRLEELLTKTLRNFSCLANGCGAPLYFVLQPNKYWMRRRKFHARELDYFSRYDERLDGYRAAGDLFGELFDWYRDTLARICERVGVEFIDLNGMIDDPRYEDICVFIDPVHLTDEGYDLAARLIAEEVLA